jgi:hypothetical protein
MTRTSAPTASALETVAFALIGAVVELPRCVPQVVAKQRTKIDQQITLARFLGKMAVTQAQNEIRRRVAEYQSVSSSAPVVQPTQTQATATRATETMPADSMPAESDESGADRAKVVPLRRSTTASELRASDLPIEHYDDLSASQVLGRLAHLDPQELDAVYVYEGTHRRRRTVLGRLEQLRSVAT